MVNMTWILRHGALLAAMLVSSIWTPRAAYSAGNIYRCEVGGQIVFSDRPCPESVVSTQVVIAPSSTYSGVKATPPKTARSVRERTSNANTTPKAQDSIAAEQLRAKQRCQRMVDRLQVIESKLRAGYKAAQGEKLRDRQRQLQQQHHAERCR